MQLVPDRPAASYGDCKIEPAELDSAHGVGVVGLTPRAKVEDHPDVEIRLPGIPMQEQFIPRPGEIGEKNADLHEGQQQQNSMADPQTQYIMEILSS